MDSKRIVNNCHKLPGTRFNRYRLTVDQIYKDLSSALKKLQDFAPGLQCLITVSPVRHLKDGLEENQRSKATLLLAVDQLCNQFDWVKYFPAYEIQMDDLRGYRFYEKDLIHPNEQAVDYIWSKFSAAYFSTATLQLNNRIEKIVTGSKHRPFHPASEAHQFFVKKQLSLMDEMEEEFPFLDFSLERMRFLG